MSFSVSLSFKDQAIKLENITTSTTGQELYQLTRQSFGWQESDEVKLLRKGKKLLPTPDIVFNKVPMKKVKIIVMATSSAAKTQVMNQRSDPLIRGFNQEKTRLEKQNEISSFWGMDGQSDKNFKFVKLEACTWQSFGHRSTESTPHAFAARRLLEKLSTDPGLRAIMKERELVVNTLGELDPIDDRIMETMEAKTGGCLLGYNTNHGLRIDIKLRTDDLQSFRPYPQLVQTLIHELSHNWVEEHDILFWTNYGQMRAEYLYYHMNSKILVNGKNTLELAGLSSSNLEVYSSIMKELVVEMQQHGLHPNMIQMPIQQRCQELEQTYGEAKAKEHRLGGDAESSSNGLSARERALAAAERRRQRQQQDEKEQ